MNGQKDSGVVDKTKAGKKGFELFYEILSNFLKQCYRDQQCTCR